MVEGQTTHYAMCILHADGGSGVSGHAKFTQVEGQPIQIKAEITGLTPGLHGFHVHQFGKYKKAASNHCGKSYLILLHSQVTSSKAAKLLDLTGTPREKPTVDPARLSDTMVISATSRLAPTARVSTTPLMTSSCLADLPLSLVAPWFATPAPTISVKVEMMSLSRLAMLADASPVVSSVSPVPSKCES